MNVTIDRLHGLEAHLKSSLLGQDRPLTEISGLLERAFLGLRDPSKPVSLFLAGPTGVGKTKSVELFTGFLYGDVSRKLIRLDMSEYSSASSAERLTGARVGERGLLGHYVDRAQGCGTLLFDELEKAHPLMLDLLLQILDAGRFTLATGETLDLTGFVVAATTNLGARVLMESEVTDHDTIARRVAAAVQGSLRPELVARFELSVCLKAIGYEDSMSIAALHAQRCISIINAAGHRIDAGKGVVQHIRSQGYSRAYGVRPIEYAAMRILGNVVKDALFQNGGQPVTGTVRYSDREQRCYLEQ